MMRRARSSQDQKLSSASDSQDSEPPATQAYNAVAFPQSSQHGSTRSRSASQTNGSSGRSNVKRTLSPRTLALTPTHQVVSFPGWLSMTTRQRPQPDSGRSPALGDGNEEENASQIVHMSSRAKRREVCDKCLGDSPCDEHFAAVPFSQSAPVIADAEPSLEAFACNRCNQSFTHKVQLLHHHRSDHRNDKDSSRKQRLEARNETRSGRVRTPARQSERLKRTAPRKKEQKREDTEEDDGEEEEESGDNGDEEEQEENGCPDEEVEISSELRESRQRATDADDSEVLAESQDLSVRLKLGKASGDDDDDDQATQCFNALPLPPSQALPASAVLASASDSPLPDRSPASHNTPASSIVASAELLSQVHLDKQSSTAAAVAGVAQVSTIEASQHSSQDSSPLVSPKSPARKKSRTTSQSQTSSQSTEASQLETGGTSLPLISPRVPSPLLDAATQPAIAASAVSPIVASQAPREAASMTATSSTPATQSPNLQRRRSTGHRRKRKGEEEDAAESNEGEEMVRRESATLEGNDEEVGPRELDDKDTPSKPSQPKRADSLTLEDSSLLSSAVPAVSQVLGSNASEQPPQPMTPTHLPEAEADANPPSVAPSHETTSNSKQPIRVSSRIRRPSSRYLEEEPSNSASDEEVPTIPVTRRQQASQQQQSSGTPKRKGSSRSSQQQSEVEKKAKIAAAHEPADDASSSLTPATPLAPAIIVQVGAPRVEEEDEGEEKEEEKLGDGGDTEEAQVLHAAESNQGNASRELLSSPATTAIVDDAAAKAKADEGEEERRRKRNERRNEKRRRRRQEIQRREQERKIKEKQQENNQVVQQQVEALVVEQQQQQQQLVMDRKADTTIEEKEKDKDEKEKTFSPKETEQRKEVRRLLRIAGWTKEELKDPKLHVAGTSPQERRIALQRAALAVVERLKISRVAAYLDINQSTIGNWRASHSNVRELAKRWRPEDGAFAPPLAAYPYLPSQKIKKPTLPPPPPCDVCKVGFATALCHPCSHVTLCERCAANRPPACPQCQVELSSVLLRRKLFKPPV